MKKTPIRDYNQSKRDYLEAEKKKRDDKAEENHPVDVTKEN